MSEMMVFGRLIRRFPATLVGLWSVALCWLGFSGCSTSVVNPSSPADAAHVVTSEKAPFIVSNSIEPPPTEPHLQRVLAKGTRVQLQSQTFYHARVRLEDGRVGFLYRADIAPIETIEKPDAKEGAAPSAETARKRRRSAPERPIPLSLIEEADDLPMPEEM